MLEDPVTLLTFLRKSFPRWCHQPIMHLQEDRWGGGGTSNIKPPASKEEHHTLWLFINAEQTATQGRTLPNLLPPQTHTPFPQTGLIFIHNDWSKQFPCSFFMKALEMQQNMHLSGQQTSHHAQQPITFLSKWPHFSLIYNKKHF